MKQTLVFISVFLLCMTFYACKQKESDIAADENSNYTLTITKADTIQSEESVKEQLDSLAIGDIYLGIDEQTFLKKKREFLNKHKKLGGLKIIRFEGSFFEGRLYDIRILSEQRMVVVKKYQDNDSFKSESTPIVPSKEDYPWIYLYSNKYPHGKFIGNSYIVKRGKCTISICDKYNPVLFKNANLSFEQIMDLTQDTYCKVGRKYPRNSFIYIVDPTIQQKVLWKEYEKFQKEQKEDEDII